MQIYKEFITAKNGSQIPAFLNGKTMESRYNPEREAESLYNSINEKYNFFLVLGIGSGTFINLLSQKNPYAKIIAFELYQDDINFLLQNENLNKLSRNPLISLCSLESLEQTLIQNYLPAKYGNLKIIEQRAWINENSAFTVKINSILTKTLGIISADFSVQSHFGKIWTSNIINNSRLAQNYSSSNKLESILKENNKTALVVAAGPSLDDTLEFFKKENSDKYYIISTDTAGLALLKRNIIPDLIVSIDAQSVSYNHFITNKDCKKTLYAFDLCANSSAARHLLESGKDLFFFCSGHPLSSAINESNNFPLPDFFSGAGTVTITALDIALKAGFKDILIFGADFSYSKGKAYTSGTYLDSLYNKVSTKLSESEQIFSKLMFRTELKETENKRKTTQILEAYKFSLEKYLTDKGIAFTKTDDIYKLHCPSNKALFSASNGKAFSLESFISKIKSMKIDEVELLLLPYVAWLRNNKGYKNFEYKKLLKLALDSIVSYNI